MNDKAKLIELLGEGYIIAIQKKLSVVETQANILLANGVTFATNDEEDAE